ncbi:glycoside hydrolase family 38 N-terminal domain-containing protein [Gracilibacillus timonensis]|uniref:glycoside hydrolase family 38 N-terminal domain-containing protein n=1 Tax=Gracilibacillus timonensis TaxID=1816696 RepID=UPI00098EC3C0|nr:hypothetical protein [Gracilibacillus timonensis]
MSKKWKLQLIHHSHTDIGYTDRQEKIEQHHVDYIKAVIDILEASENGSRPEWQGYKWTCENYWQVERFFQQAETRDKQKFIDYVKAGKIDISLTYLNMTELVDNDILDHMFKKGRAFSNQHQLGLDAAMTADINGFSWGYAETMYQNGIINLYSCLHTHHGMFPLYQKQIPFWWETPKGNKVLVWNGDHYQIGNDFMLIPNSFRIDDGAEMTTLEDQLEVAEQRIFEYLDNLEQEGYPFDFVPNMISGIMTDNSPPNPRLIEMIHCWNEKHGDQVEIELITLHQFFTFLRGQALDLPVYAGDWTDWWADGVGSTPAPTKIYRDAQRKYHLTQKLDPQAECNKGSLVQEAEYQLMLYAEHTWGYASSVSEPWNTLVNDLDYRKAAYAINANRFLSQQLDQVLRHRGEVPPSIDREKYFKVVNPHDHPVTDYAMVPIKHWEHIDGRYLAGDLEKVVDVMDCQTNERLTAQLTSIPSGVQIEFAISLEAKEERVVKLVKANVPKQPRIKNYAHIGTDRVEDLAAYPGYAGIPNTHVLESEHYRISFDQTTGIISLWDKWNDQELIHQDAPYAPFAGVYEKTPITTDACTERRLMGRNRKGRLAERHHAHLKHIEVTKDGDLFTMLQMDFDLAGTQAYSVLLKLYKDIPKIAVTVRIQKQNEWAPENLYIALPFQMRRNGELFIEKTGAMLRPVIDQLPGTNTEFYSLQNGLAFTGDESAFVVAIKDTPLITLGSLAHHPVELANPKLHEKNQQPVYSWVMNNFWETNFKVDLSGFYEFDYQLYLVTEQQSPAQLMEKCQQLNQGLVAFPINPE